MRSRTNVWDAAGAGVYYERVLEMLPGENSRWRAQVCARGLIAVFEKASEVLRKEWSFFSASLYLDSIRGYAQALGADVREELTALCKKPVRMAADVAMRERCSDQYETCSRANCERHGPLDHVASFAAASDVDVQKLLEDKVGRSEAEMIDARVKYARLRNGRSKYLLFVCRDEEYVVRQA